MKDLYEILGLKRDSTEEEIKQAYKVLAKTFHPDVSKHPNAEENFIDIQNAYETLIDKDKRYEYDGSYYEGYYHDEELYEYHDDYNGNNEHQYYNEESSRQYNYEYDYEYSWRDKFSKSMISIVIISSILIWSISCLSYIVVNRIFEGTGIEELTILEITLDLIVLGSILYFVWILAYYLWWMGVFVVALYLFSLLIWEIDTDLLIITFIIVFVYFIYYFVDRAMVLEEEYLEWISFSLLIMLVFRDIIFYDFWLTILITMFVLSIVFSFYFMTTIWDEEYIESREIVIAGIMLPLIGSFIMYAAFKVEEGY